MSWPSHVAVTLPAASFRPRQPSQCTLILFTERLDLEGVRPSVGSVGDAYDNALMESVIDLYKTEYIRTTVFHAGPYRNPGRRRVRLRRMGRLVQQPTPPQHPRLRQPSRL